MFHEYAGPSSHTLHSFSWKLCLTSKGESCTNLQWWLLWNKKCKHSKFRGTFMSLYVPCWRFESRVQLPSALLYLSLRYTLFDVFSHAITITVLHTLWFHSVMLLCGVHSVLASVCARCHNYTHHHPTDTTQEPDTMEPQFMEDTEITWEKKKV